MKLLQVDFEFSGPWGEEFSKSFEWLANDISLEKGLIWKIWTENFETKEAGGIYLFETLIDADKYIKKHTERLNSFGIDKVNYKIFEVNEPLTKINKGII